jgi:transposase
MATTTAPSRPAYATDLTDAQWKLIDPILPPPNLNGRHEKHPRREIVNAIFYILRTGCAWRHLPHDLPPWQTVYRYFRRWSENGTVDRVHDRLRDRLRDAEGRDPAASAGIIDSQSVKGADTVGTPTRGYDAGKRINGRKRHIVTDTLGLLMLVMVTTASVQDREGGARILERLRFAMPSIVTVFADGGYAGRLVIYARQ